MKIHHHSPQAPGSPPSSAGASFVLSSRLVPESPVASAPLGEHSPLVGCTYQALPSSFWMAWCHLPSSNPEPENGLQKELAETLTDQNPQNPNTFPPFSLHSPSKEFHRNLVGFSVNMTAMKKHPMKQHHVRFQDYMRI